MIKFKESKNIYLYSENIDMRIGMNKIQILVASNFTKIEIRHSVFVFCGTNGRQMYTSKINTYDKKKKIIKNYSLSL